MREGMRGEVWYTVYRKISQISQIFSGLPEPSVFVYALRENKSQQLLQGGYTHGR